MRVSEVGVIMLDQFPKMHALGLDVPFGALYRAILTNVTARCTLRRPFLTVVPKTEGISVSPLCRCPTLLDNTWYLVDLTV